MNTKNITTKYKTNYYKNMVKQLKSLTLFQQIIAGVTITASTTLLFGVLVMWRTLAVHSSRLDNIEKAQADYTKNMITPREYDELKTQISTEFVLTREIMQQDRNFMVNINSKLDQHLNKK